MAETTQPRAGIYGRQSAGKAKSITEQISECTTDVQRQGWTLAGTYQDGSSASRYARKDRDDWQRVLADVEAGTLDVLVLWESSRGDRDLPTWAALLATCRTRGVKIRVTTHARTYDMSNARDWRSLAEDGIDSAYESEKTSLRVRRGHAAAAADGRPSHGRTPYGYRRTYDPRTGALVGQELDPETAPIVRDIIDRAARGVPISAIVDDLNERKVPTLTASRWYRVRVRDIATNPAYAGIRTYNGLTYEGNWPPMIDPSTFYAAQRVLADPTRVTTRPGRQKHLLSYLGTCDPCGAGLTAVRGRYRCSATGCVTILQAPTDDLITGVILGRLSRPDAYKALRHEGADSDRAVIAARNEVAQLRTMLDEWRRSAAQGQTTPASLAVIEADLSAQIRAADRRAEQAAVPPALRQILEPGADVRVRWDAAPLPARREVIRALAVVTVRPADAPGSRMFEPQRLGGSRWIGDDRTWAEHWTEDGL